MRKLIYEAIVLIGILVLMLGLAIPWIISNDTLPLWLDAILFVTCAVGWIEISRPVFKRILRKAKELRKVNE